MRERMIELHWAWRLLPVFRLVLRCSHERPVRTAMSSICRTVHFIAYGTYGERNLEKSIA